MKRTVSSAFSWPAQPSAAGAKLKPAFPLISAGVYGYPKREAMQIAIDTIRECIRENDIKAYIVAFGDEMYRIGKELI